MPVPAVAHIAEDHHLKLKITDIQGELVTPTGAAVVAAFCTSEKLPEDFNYEDIHGLRKEAIQKLNLVKPVSIGQASRISGVSPADISVILVYLEQLKYQNTKK